LSAAFTDTQLKLDQNEKGEVPSGTIVVPNLIGPRTVKNPFYTAREPMVFRAKGATSTVRLNVTTNSAVQSGVVAPDTVSKFGGRTGVGIEARRLTWPERAGSFGKAEVVLALIAVVLAVVTIVAVFVAPSADQTVGRADLAAQLQPIEQRLTTGISTHDPRAVQRAQTQLRATLETSDQASNVGTGLAVATGALGLISAVIACGVAAKRAKTTV
jgi:hypothetical protein